MALVNSDDLDESKVAKPPHAVKQGGQANLQFASSRRRGKCLTDERGEIAQTARVEKNRCPCRILDAHDGRRLSAKRGSHLHKDRSDAVAMGVPPRDADRLASTSRGARRETRAGGLWGHSAFLTLWGGQTISQLGSQVSLLALPLTAVLVLDATPGQMGFLYATQTVPFLLVGLVAGVWVDRLPKRRILIGGDLGRALLLSWIPLAAVLHVLRIEQLYGLAVLVGLCTVFFDVAYQSVLPVLVGREHLVEGNSKLEIGRSAAQIAGPAIGGALVQLLTAPVAIVVDALSFLVSALFLVRVRMPNSPPVKVNQGAWTGMREGIEVVLGNPLLRAIAGCTGSSNLFGSALQAVFMLFATSDLGLSPVLLGLALGGGSVGALVGAILVGRLARHVGMGPSIVGGIVLGGLAGVLVALAAGPAMVAAAILATARALLGFGGVVYNVNQVSLRQAITPDGVQGRMNATMRFIVWGTIPIGALLGGFLGEVIGLRGTLVVAAVGALLTPLWVLQSPVRQLRDPPQSCGVSM